MNASHLLQGFKGQKLQARAVHRLEIKGQAVVVCCQCLEACLLMLCKSAAVPYGHHTHTHTHTDTEEGGRDRE